MGLRTAYAWSIASGRRGGYVSEDKGFEALELRKGKDTMNTHVLSMHA